jgi:hypothetical protein
MRKTSQAKTPKSPREGKGSTGRGKHTSDDFYVSLLSDEASTLGGIPTGKQEPVFTPANNSKTLEEVKLHKQPRALLKTVSKRIGNSTEEPSLFSLPIDEGQKEVVFSSIREDISKNTVALAFYLIQQYQEAGNTYSDTTGSYLEITNLKAIAKVIGCTNHRLKLYLLHLGGYVYPIIDKDEDTKELVIANEQLFKIEFRYSEKVASRYSVKNGEIQGVERVGTNLMNFIKDEPIDRILVSPNERFIRAFEGKGLGNILTVSDRFVALILELTDIAAKILAYSSSNKPSYKIGEDNLINHLGLTRQLRSQGRPRVRATILKGLQELKDKGHITSYSFNEAKQMYSYTYSDKYIRYKEPNKSRKKPQ